MYISTLTPTSRKTIRNINRFSTFRPNIFHFSMQAEAIKCAFSGATHVIAQLLDAVMARADWGGESEERGMCLAECLAGAT